MKKRNDNSGEVNRAGRFNMATYDCVVQHINAFLEQSLDNKQADFRASCAKCEYANECNFDWYRKMKPLLQQSRLNVPLYLPEHLPR